MSGVFHVFSNVWSGGNSDLRQADLNEGASNKNPLVSYDTQSIETTIQSCGLVSCHDSSKLFFLGLMLVSREVDGIFTINYIN